jgi:diacylglycerol kinase family enzyme
VYNPTKVDLPKLKKSVAAAAKSAGWDTSLWFATTENDSGQGVTASALKRGAQLIITAGGDGTVRAVAEALRHADVPIAVVPSGTGNLLARNLDLPLADVESSLETAFEGEDRVIDLGIVRIVRAGSAKDEEHAFLVMAGLGIDAKMIKNTSTKLKRAVGWLAYVDGITRSLPEMKPLRVRYRLDGAPEHPMSVHSIIIGNCGALPGGILLMPDARPDDGLLDIAALRPRGPFGWFKVWNKLTWENGVLRRSAIGRKIIDLSRDVRDVTYFTGQSMTIALESPQEFQLDGDEFGEAQSVVAWVDAGALTVKVPAVVESS